MKMKEHPFVVTSSFVADGVTITYDKNVENRSTAVGKAFKLNAQGKAALVNDGDEIVGKVLAVDDDNIMTGAYIFGGLSLPLGENATVARGDKLVGALGPKKAKGYVQKVDAAAALDALEATDINDDTKKLDAFNAARAEITKLVNAQKSNGTVIDFDEWAALVALV